MNSFDGSVLTINTVGDILARYSGHLPNYTAPDGGFTLSARKTDGESTAVYRVDSLYFTPSGIEVKGTVGAHTSDEVILDTSKFGVLVTRTADYSELNKECQVVLLRTGKDPKHEVFDIENECSPSKLDGVSSSVGFTYKDNKGLEHVFNMAPLINSLYLALGSISEKV